MKEEKIKYFVVKAMSNDRINRNSDKWLVFNVLKEMGFNIRFDVDQVADMPSFETITRIRREVQNNEKRLLADDEVDEARRDKESEFQERYMGGGGINGIFEEYKLRHDL